MGVYKCPVCDGRGLVRGDFYSNIENDSNSTKLSAPFKETCRSCNGKGIVFDPTGEQETFAEHYGCLPATWDDIQPTETLEMSNIPNCCKACPNHPSNGGSGICNCAAPYFEKDFAYTCLTQSSNVPNDW